MLKGCTRSELINSITGAAAGQLPMKAGELRRVATTMANRLATADPDIPLTQRETQVLRHMALGLSNKEIAQSLTISVETVKEHVQNILRKIAVSDRTQAAVWAVRRGLV
jgi:DNA-binding NarL/FixJ family response regulator